LQRGQTTAGSIVFSALMTWIWGRSQGKSLTPSSSLMNQVLIGTLLAGQAGPAAPSIEDEDRSPNDSSGRLDDAATRLAKLHGVQV
jgi:hypothetical protein